jgi:hypothetical protein
MIINNLKKFDEVVVDILENLLQCLSEDQKAGRIDIDPDSPAGKLIETASLLVKYVRP